MLYKISNFNESSRIMNIIVKIISIILYIIIIPVIIFNFTLIIKSFIYPNEVPDFLKIKTFVIVSESMEPTIMTGDAIFIKEVKQEELKVNDIISFKEKNSIINTHRIVAITNDNGITRYTTKGDNNIYEDKNKITYDEIEGKYLFKLNGFGRTIKIIQKKTTLIILLIILILISSYQIRISKRKLKRKEKRNEFNKKSQL